MIMPREGTRKALVQQVSALGLAAVACQDTASAEAATAGGAPDVVIADGALAQGDLLRVLSLLGEPKVVLVSAAPLDSAARRGLRAAWGPEQVIVQAPVRRQALREAVLHALGLHERPPPVSLRPRAPVSASSLRVLVAEDNPVNQRVVLLLLAKLGHRADVVGNGAEAVEAVIARRYDVVFMDVRMPEIDGIEATRRIHAALPAGSRPHIVALTANAMSEDRDACIEAGMDDFVSKPVTGAELVRALRGAHARVAAAAAEGPAAI